MTALTEDPSKVIVAKLLEPEQCRSLIERGSAERGWHSTNFLDTRTGRMVVDKTVRDARVLAELEFPAPFAEARAALSRALARFVGPGAQPRFGLSSLQLVRYDKDGLFAPHRDSEAQVERWRRYSLVCYLNEEFEEGGTTFPNVGKTVKPPAGYGIIFPSYYWHGGTPVRSGTKYVMLGYLGDPETMPANA
jgi:2OG-Fe(II) oxygenase superfamily